MKMGWFLEGGVNVDVAKNSGDADILVPIKGPKGTAFVHTIGVREGGVWTIQEMTATVEGTGNTVDLLAD
jgi:Cytochrome oxidase complex assembly protein 1